MPGPSETLPALDQRLAGRLLAFDLLDEAWPKGRTAIERAEIGRQSPHSQVAPWVAPEAIR